MINDFLIKKISMMKRNSTIQKISKREVCLSSVSIEDVLEVFESLCYSFENQLVNKIQNTFFGRCSKCRCQNVH